MISGRLNKKVSIESRVETKNSLGEDITTWKNFINVWAKISPISGKEYLSNNETKSIITGRISIRYVSGITVDMRIIYNSRVFDIVSIINTEERNRELIMMVEEYT